MFRGHLLPRRQTNWGDQRGTPGEQNIVSACSQTSIVISSFPPRKARASEVTEHSGWDLGHNSGVKSIRAKTSCCRGPRTHPDLGDVGQECRIIGVRVLRNQSYFPKSRTAEVSLWQIFHYFEKINSIKKKKKSHIHCIYPPSDSLFVSGIDISDVTPCAAFLHGSSIVIQSLYFDYLSQPTTETRPASSCSQIPQLGQSQFGRTHSLFTWGSQGAL